MRTWRCCGGYCRPTACSCWRALASRLRWSIVLVYGVSLVRAEMPLGAASLQLTVLLLAFISILVFRELPRALSAPRSIGWGEAQPGDYSSVTIGDRCNSG